MPQLRGNEPILGLNNVEVNFLRVKVMVYFEATGILDDNRGKALQGSHNDHPKSMTSGEEFSFKVPPNMRFTTITTHVLMRNMIMSRESTNPTNGPMPIFEWNRYETPFYHITHCTKC
jgi:hypothetical protein